MKHSLAPRRAFTLIEILVVIAIIGILSAILFPVLSRARENARAKVCISNLKQLGLSFQQYAQDSGGKYPLAAPYQKWAFGAHWVTGGTVDPATGAQTVKNFTNAEMGLATPATFETVEGHQAFPQNPASALSSYTKSAEIYLCPSAPDKNKRKLSYSMNCAVAGLSVSRIRSTGDIILLVDEGKTINDGYFWATASADSTDQLFDGHNGGGNLLYVDGHVKFMQSKSVPADFKTRLTGAPRFHDRAFGSITGSSLQPPNSSDAATKDSCSGDLVAGA